MPLDVTERYKKCRAVIDGAAQPQLKGLDVTDRYNKARANIEKSLSSGQLNNPAQINPNVLGGMDILNAQSGKARAPEAVEAAAGASLKRQGLDEQYGGWLDKQYISNADVFDDYIRERDARQNAEKNRLGVSATQIKNLASGNAAETAAAQRVKNATGLSDEDLDAVYKRVKLGHGEAANYYSGRVLKGAANSAIGAGQFLTSTAYKALSVPASLIDATVSAVTGKNATQLEKTMTDAASSVYDKNSPQERLKSWLDDKVEGPVKNKYFSKGQRIAGDLAENVGAMLPAIAAGGAAGLAGATSTGVKAANYLTFGSGAAGNATKEALDAGADIDTAYAYGISSGMLEVLTEEMFAGIAGMPGGAVTEALGKVMKKLEKNGTVRLLTDIFGEGVEEVVSEWLTPYLKRATYDKNAALASWQDIMKSFGSGALLSAFMQGAGGALTGQLGSGTSEGMTEAPALMEDRSGRVDERAVDDVLTAPNAERRALPPLRVQGNPELRPLPPLIRTREGRTGSGLSGDELTVKNTAAWPYELRDAVNALGKKLKTRIVVDDSIEGGKANGYYDDYYETIHIAADAENPVLQVALHEATHRMRTLSAEAYAAFRDYAVGMAGENAVANKLLEAQNRAARMLSRSTMTEEKAKDEIAAELAERFMTDEEAVTAFIRTNRTAAQRFFDALRSIIQTIKEALGGERTLTQAERLWKRAFEKAEASSRAEALSRGEVSSQADSRENEVYLGILFDKWAKGEITNEELDRAFSELSDVSDIAANENAAEAGGEYIRQYSIIDIQGENGSYGQGVLLDTNIFDGVKQNRWGEVLGNYVYQKLAGRELTLYDENGNTETVYLARENDRVKKDGAKNSHPVLGELAGYGGKKARAKAIIQIDEVLATSKHKETTDEHSHQWLDENGWEKRTTYLQDLDGNIYEATLNIADGRDRRILYDVSRVHMIDKKRSIGKNTVTGENQRSRYQEPRTGPSQSDALANRIAESGKTVNREYSLKTGEQGQLEVKDAPKTPKKREAKKPPHESYPTTSKRDLRRDMLSIFSIPEGQRDYIGKIIDQYADKMLKQGRLDQQDMDAFFDRMYDAGVMSVPADEYYSKVRDFVKDGHIYVRPSLKSEFGDDWAEFRRRAFGAGIYFTDNSHDMEPDVWNANLAEEFPGTFSADEYDERSILERIVQMAEEGKEKKLSLDEYAAMLSQQEYVSENEILDNLERQMEFALKTFAEKAKLEINLRDRTGVKIAETKAASRQLREDERNRHIAIEERDKERHKKLREDERNIHKQMEAKERARHEELRERERLQHQQTRARERERRREMAKFQRERRELKDLQQKTLKQLQWLSKNRYRAPEELRATWDDVLSDIDIYVVSAADEMHWSKEHNATWRDVAEMYKYARENDPNFLPSKELERIVARVDGTKIGEMDPDALSNLYKAAIGLRTEYYNRNNVINDEQMRLFAEIYTEAKQEIEGAEGGFTGKKTDKLFNLEQLTPMNVLERMGGWNRDGAFYSMARQLEEGEREMRDYRVKAERRLDDFLKNHEDWVKKADGQGKDAIWYELEVPELLEYGKGDKPLFGDSVKVYMTPAQKVHMYLESKSYDNLRHMTGGRTFVDKELYSKGKRQEAFAQGKTIRLAPESVKNIVSKLTEEERELAGLLEDYYNNFAAKQINEKSNILYGYDKAVSKNYAPIYTDRNYVNSEIGIFDTTAEGIGNLKSRQISANPSYNISAFDAFEKHIDQTARFVGMAIPARNWQTLLNWREKNNSMGAVITHKWGEEGKRYITDLLVALQGNGPTGKKTLDGAADKLLSNYVTSVFGANPGIVLKQAASFPQLAAALGWENVPRPNQMLRIDEKIINAYTSELAFRALGYATPETAQLKNNPNFLDSNKATRFLIRGGAITAMDVGTVKRAWPWAENKVRREHPELEIGNEEQIKNGESSFYKKVAEEFENAVSLTQPMYDEMHRPYIMKNANGITRAFTMFKTVPLQQYNSLRRAFGEMKAAKRRMNNASEAIKEQATAEYRAAAKRAGASVTATLASVLMLEGIEILNQLIKNRGKKYRDDDDELTAASIAERLSRNIFGDLAGMIVGGDELTDLLANWFLGEKWYGIEIPGGEQLNDIIDAVGGAAGTIQKIVAEGANVAANGGDLGEYFRRNGGDYAGAAKDVAEKFAMYLGGLPVQNVEKYIMGAVQSISPELYAGMEDVFDTPTKNDLRGLGSGELAARTEHILRTRGVDVSDETSAALAELYEGDYKASIPTDTPKSITVNGEERALNAYQRQTFDKVWSKTIERSLDALVGSPVYQDADSERQAKMIDKIYDYATEKAKAELFDDYEEKSSTKKADNMLAAGSDIAEWAAWSVTASDVERNEQYEQVLTSDMSDSSKLAAIGNLIGTEMKTESGNPTQWAKLNTVIDDGYSVDEALELMQAGKLDTYMRWSESDAKAAGVDADAYMDYRGVLNNTAADKDASGKTISGSKKQKVLDYIDGLKLTDEQKDALYYDAGYTESGISDAPWHSGSKAKLPPLKKALPPLTGPGASGKKLPPLTGPGTSGKKLPPLTGPGATAKKLPPLKSREELSSSPVSSFAGYTTPIPEPAKEEKPPTYTEVFLRMQEEERARQPKTLYADYLRGMD